MQLMVEHHWCIDLVLWPEMRENMIRNQSKMDIDAAIGLFLCSLRVRKSFNANIIVRRYDGDLELESEFYKQCTDTTNWGLLEPFWTTYPFLVQGLSPKIRLEERDLLAT